MIERVSVDVLYGMVKREMQRAVDLHGPLSTNHETALRILVEEVGEAAEAIHDIIHAKTAVERGMAKIHLRTELVQVTATALRWLQNAEEDVS